MMDEISSTYALGAIGFLTKPIKSDRLLGILRRYLPGPTDLQPILVVDDDPVSRKMMAKVLETEGWSVVEAENGKVAIQQIEQQVPVLILLDLIMPEMGGYEVFSELRKRREWKAIPVVFCISSKCHRGKQAEYSRIFCPPPQ